MPGAGGQPASEGGTSSVGGEGGSGDPPFALDPGEVYLFGTLSEGAAYVDALAHLSTPDTPMLGFPSSSSFYGWILGSGEFVYGANDLLRVFVPDSSKNEAGGFQYPTMPDRNDPILPAPACEVGTRAVQPAPDGRYLYRCGASWYEDDESVFGGSGTLLAFNGDFIAVFGTTNLMLVNIDDGERHQIAEVTRTPYAIRAADGGFRLVPAPESDALPLEAWEVLFDGTAAKIGEYPPLPIDVLTRGDYTLDANGALYEFGGRINTSDDVVVRRTIDGESEVVYDEGNGPLVKVHGSTLVTGP